MMPFRSLVATALSVAVLLPAGALAQLDNPFGQLDFPGEAPNDSVLRIQKVAERRFDAGEYRDAYWYFTRELVPIGDKYAQYMVGYMTANGLGTERDPVRAAAWYLLAAERGHKDLLAQSKAALETLSPEQRMRAQQILGSLKAEYGDKELIERLIRRDIDRLRDTTGQRTRSWRCNRASNLRVYRPGQALGSIDGSRYCQMINDRIDARIEYLTGYVEYGTLELLPDEEEDNPDEPADSGDDGGQTRDDE